MGPDSVKVKYLFSPCLLSSSLPSLTELCVYLKKTYSVQTSVLARISVIVIVGEYSDLHGLVQFNPCIATWMSLPFFGCECAVYSGSVLTFHSKSSPYCHNDRLCPVLVVHRIIIGSLDSLK